MCAREREWCLYACVRFVCVFLNHLNAFLPLQASDICNPVKFYSGLNNKCIVTLGICSVC